MAGYVACENCRTKKDREGCPGMEWYAPRQIRFCRVQMIWLLSWLPLLREGSWPANPQPTGYTETPRVQHSRSLHASFETPCQIAAEVDARLARCGLDRYLLEDCFIWGMSEDELAGKLGIPVEDVSWRITSALNYISGWRRKLYSLQDWRGHRRVKTLSNN
jgi:hypothetical protein